MNNETKEFGKGGKHTPIRNWFRPKYEDLELVGGATPAFDWNVGYDVEQEVSNAIGFPFKLPVNNQGQSYSCGGQAASKILAIDEALLKKIYTERSARDAYSQIFFPQGGTTAAKIKTMLVTKGVSTEGLVSSYDSQGNPLTETAYRIPALQTDRVTDNVTVSVDFKNIDNLAKAIRDFSGVVLLIKGQDNGTWRSPNPRPSVWDSTSWLHFVVLGKAFLNNGIKTIGFLNSWGTQTGDNGWQYLTEDYMKAGGFMDAFGTLETGIVSNILVQPPTSALRLLVDKLMAILGL